MGQGVGANRFGREGRHQWMADDVHGLMDSGSFLTGSACVWGETSVECVNHGDELFFCVGWWTAGFGVLVYWCDDHVVVCHDMMNCLTTNGVFSTCRSIIST